MEAGVNYDVVDDDDNDGNDQMGGRNRLLKVF